MGSTIYHVRPRGLNIGNEVIALGTRVLARSVFGEHVNLVSVPATRRYEGIAECGLTARTVFAINRYADAVVVGGGNFYENGELDVDLQALGALRKPLMLFSVSRGRIYDNLGRLWRRSDAMPDSTVRALNEHAWLSLARDIGTHAYLQELGFGDVQLGGCPTLFLGSMSQYLPDYADEFGQTALIGVRTPELMSVPVQVESRTRDDIRELTGLLRGKGLSVRILCHDRRDVGFARSLADVAGYVYTESVHDFLGILRSVPLLLSYRLHGFIPAMMLGTQSLHLSYDERGRSLVETVGLLDRDVDVIAGGLASTVESRLTSLRDVPAGPDVGRSRELRELMAEAFDRLSRTMQKGENER